MPHAVPEGLKDRPSARTVQDGMHRTLFGLYRYGFRKHPRPEASHAGRAHGSVACGQSSRKGKGGFYLQARAPMYATQPATEGGDEMRERERTRPRAGRGFPCRGGFLAGGYARVGIERVCVT